MDNSNYNGFKALEKEIIENQSPSDIKKVESNLKANKGAFDFIGDMLSLYLPEVFSVITKLIGGNKK